MRVSGVFLEVIRNAGRGTPADHLPVKQIQIVDAACQKRPVVFLCSNAGRTSRCCMRNHPIPAGHRVLKERQRGREEGQQEEKQYEQNQYGKGEKESGTAGPDSFFQRKAQEKGQNDGDQKNEDVGPERMNSRDARKGIEKNGNGRKTGKDAEGACRIKGGTGAADQGFQSGEEEEGKESSFRCSQTDSLTGAISAARIRRPDQSNRKCRAVPADMVKRIPDRRKTRFSYFFCIMISSGMKCFRNYYRQNGEISCRISGQK